MADDDLIQDIMNRARGFPGSSPFDAKAVAAMGSDFSFPDTPSKSDSIADLLSPSSDSPQKFEGIPTKTGERMDMDLALRGMGVGGTTLTDADKEMIDSMKQRNAMLEKIKEKEIKDLQQFQKDRMELMAKQPKVPQIGNIPKAPQSQFRNPFEAFQNPAVMLGMLGSLFTRQPLTTAFNAAAAAMKGFHEGDTEVIKQETTNWKNAVDAALQQNQKEIDEYKLQWDKHKENYNDLLSNFEVTAAVNKDEQMLTLLKFAGPKEIYEMIETREKAHMEMEKARADVIKARAEAIKAQAQADNLRNLKSGGGIGGWDADAIHDAAEAWIKTGKSPTNLGTRETAGAIKGMIQTEAHRIMAERGLKMSDVVRNWQSYAAEGSALRLAEGRFGSGPQGNAIRSFNVAVDHLSTLREVGKALKTGDVNFLNSVSLMFQEEFGSPVPTNFDALKQIVADEVVKAVVGSGSGALGDRQEAAANIKRSRSPAQLDGVIDNYERLMIGQLHGLEQQYKFNTNKDNFRDMLSDATKGEIERITGKYTPGAKPAAEPTALPPGWKMTEIDKETGKPIKTGEANLDAADEAMNLTPQEKKLYQFHLGNLRGSGGVDNPGGTRSTIFNITFEENGKTYIAPTVWDGKIHSAQEAMQRAEQMGLDNFPSYDSEEEANARYEQLHSFMEKDTQALQQRATLPGAPGLPIGGF